MLDDRFDDSDDAGVNEMLDVADTVTAVVRDRDGEGLEERLSRVLDDRFDESDDAGVIEILKVADTVTAAVRDEEELCELILVLVELSVKMNETVDMALCKAVRDNDRMAEVENVGFAETVSEVNEVELRVSRPLLVEVALRLNCAVIDVDGEMEEGMLFEIVAEGERVFNGEVVCDTDGKELGVTVPEESLVKVPDAQLDDDTLFDDVVLELNSEFVAENEFNAVKEFDDVVDRVTDTHEDDVALEIFIVKEEIELRDADGEVESLNEMIDEREVNAVPDADKEVCGETVKDTDGVAERVVDDERLNRADPESVKDADRVPSKEPVKKRDDEVDSVFMIDTETRGERVSVAITVGVADNEMVEVVVALLDSVSQILIEYSALREKEVEDVGDPVNTADSVAEGLDMTVSDTRADNVLVMITEAEIVSVRFEVSEVDVVDVLELVDVAVPIKFVFDEVNEMRKDADEVVVELSVI